MVWMAKLVRDSEAQARRSTCLLACQVCQLLATRGCLVFCSWPPSCLQAPLPAAASPSPAWAMHYPRKIEDLMEVISIGGWGGAAPFRIGKEGRTELVGSFAYPKVGVLWRGSLKLRRDSCCPFLKGSGLVESQKRHGTNLLCTECPGHQGSPWGDPQPPAAL